MNQMLLSALLTMHFAPAKHAIQEWMLWRQYRGTQSRAPLCRLTGRW
jgi:hypothetical protein